jgi:hypothetical protein
MKLRDIVVEKAIVPNMTATKRDEALSAAREEAMEPLPAEIALETADAES